MLLSLFKTTPSEFSLSQQNTFESVYRERLANNNVHFHRANKVDLTNLSFKWNKNGCHASYSRSNHSFMHAMTTGLTNVLPGLSSPYLMQQQAQQTKTIFISNSEITHTLDQCSKNSHLMHAGKNRI